MFDPDEPTKDAAPPKTKDLEEKISPVKVIAVKPVGNKTIEDDDVESEPESEVKSQKQKIIEIEKV